MKLLISFILPVWLIAVPLEVLIENARDNHTSLKSIEQKISMIDNEIEISQNFADPIISLTVSDIQFDDISNRSLERMQYTALNFQQKIPYFGKRDAQGRKIKAKKDKVTLSMYEMKVKLVREIKIAAFSIWQIEEELKITDEYIRLTKQNIELYSSASTIDSKSHMSIMSAEMTLSELKIKKNRLQSSLLGLYKKLSYLSEIDVKSVEMDMKIFKPNDVAEYIQIKSANLSYKIKKASLNEANEDIKVKELSSYIDPVIKVGYYNRESFDDYANIGLSFSIPIYGTQDQQEEKSRKLSLASKNEVIDFNNLLVAQISEVHARLSNSYEIHRIIKHESMPQIEHMFELSSSSIKSGDELFLFIELLGKKLSLDEQNIGVVAAYHRDLAILDALIGEMK